MTQQVHRFRPFALVIAVLAPAFLVQPQAGAQSADQHFVAVDSAPFGAGDRLLELDIQLLSGDTIANVQVWVIYGENRDQVASGTVGAAVPHGRAQLGTVNSAGVVRASFVFPHTDHKTPNQTDVRPARIRSGRTVYYKVVKVRGSTRIDSAIQTFVMPDKLTIVNFGDSYASGEGAPYYTPSPMLAKGSDLWDSVLCHRSGNSGQARAVRTLKNENPATAIAFKNVACSGAEVGAGLLQSQLRPSWAFESAVLQTPVQPQLQAAARWLNDNGYSEMNIAMISGGGNDVRFGSYVEEYLVKPFVFKAGDEAARNLEQVIANDIPSLYQALRAALDRDFTYDRILISEYPDPLHGPDGNFCELDPVLSPRAEAKAITDSFLLRLNSTIRSTIAAFPNWKFVDGAMAAARGHGLCNKDDPFFNNGLAESIGMQGDIFGIVHPTRRGHARIYKPIYEAELRQALRSVRLKWAKEAAKREAREKISEAQARQRQRLPTIAAGSPAANVPSTVKQLTLRAATLRVGTAMGLDAATIARARQLASSLPRPASLEPENRMPDDQE